MVGYTNLIKALEEVKNSTISKKSKEVIEKAIKSYWC